MADLKSKIAVEEILLKGECLCGAPAEFTARTTPIGATMVGDLDCEYTTCCGVHFPEFSCYHNPSLSLVNPEQAAQDFYMEKLRPLSFFCDKKRYCAALCAARLTLQSGQEMECISCPECHKVHLDEFRFATKPHHIH